VPVLVEALPDATDVVVVTLDRPERRNALDHATLQSLRDAITHAVDQRARVLVLTGAAGHFCAGADLTGVEDEGFVDLLRSVLEGLHSAPFPVVAAIEGAALGAGTQLAMSCDLRIATADASFGIPAAKLGLTVDHWTVQQLARHAGDSLARVMLLGAEVLRGDRLYASGFVHRLVDEGGVAEPALAWARELRALAPLTIAAHKVMLGVAEHVEEPPPVAVEARAAAWASADLQEGLAAFRERRTPDFRWR
jgi:enoyl-CoA hydratase